MAVGEKTNLELVVDSILVDLGRINHANGFWTDVKQVGLPFWSPASDMVMSFEAPSLQLWIMEAKESAEYSAIGSPRYDMTTWVGGTIKADREPQRKLWRMDQDVTGVMLWNPARLYPGSSSANTYGFFSEHIRTRFYVEEEGTSQGSGKMVSEWRVVVNVPSPNG